MKVEVTSQKTSKERVSGEESPALSDPAADQVRGVWEVDWLWQCFDPVFDLRRCGLREDGRGGRKWGP